MPSQEANALGSAEKSTVRDKSWLWGHDAGAHNDGWGLPRPSRMTPTEAAFYLGVPNLIRCIKSASTLKNAIFPRKNYPVDIVLGKMDR
jgi:hypothetical protein